MEKNRVGWKFDSKQVFNPTFSQAHPTQFSCWIGLRIVSSNISFLWRHFECYNFEFWMIQQYENPLQNNNNKKITHIKSKWPPCVSRWEIRSSICFKTVSKSFTHIQNIFLNAYRSAILLLYYVLEATQVMSLLYHSRVLPRRGFSSSESTSSDSIADDIEWKNEWTCMFDETYWMAHINVHSTFLQHLSNISYNILDKL